MWGCWGFFKGWRKKSNPKPTDCHNWKRRALRNEKLWRTAHNSSPVSVPHYPPFLTFFSPSGTNPAINMFRVQLYLMMSMECHSAQISYLQLLGCCSFPSCIIHSQVSYVSDLHTDMWRVPWIAEGKPSFKYHVTAADGKDDEKSHEKENTPIFSWIISYFLQATNHF